MNDRQTVVKGLECCQDSSKSHCGVCPYIYKGLCSTNDCTSDLASDALTLLKEQDRTISQLEYNLAVAEQNMNYYVNGNN